jgi:hypothetical protein
MRKIEEQGTGKGGRGCISTKRGRLCNKYLQNKTGGELGAGSSGSAGAGRQDGAEPGSWGTGESCSTSARCTKGCLGVIVRST